MNLRNSLGKLPKIQIRNLLKILIKNSFFFEDQTFKVNSVELNQIKMN